MIDVLALLAYAASWTCSTVLSARWLADNYKRCQSKGYTRSTCRSYHGRDCWSADGVIEPSRFVLAGAASLVWPLLILPAIAYGISIRKPTRVGLEQEIARLEREAGIR